jgi:hypothetical protein
MDNHTKGVHTARNVTVTDNVIIAVTTAKNGYIKIKTFKNKNKIYEIKRTPLGGSVFLIGPFYAFSHKTRLRLDTIIRDLFNGLIY